MTFNLTEYNEKEGHPALYFFATLEKYVEGDYKYNYFGGAYSEEYADEDDFIQFLVDTYKENEEELRADPTFVEFSDKQFIGAFKIFNEKKRNFEVAENKQRVEREAAEAIAEYKIGKEVVLNRKTSPGTGILELSSESEMWDAKDIDDDYIYLHSGAKLSRRPIAGFDYNSKGYIRHGSDIKFALTMGDVRIGYLHWTFIHSGTKWKFVYGHDDDNWSLKSVKIDEFPSNRKRTILYILNKMSEELCDV